MATVTAFTAARSQQIEDEAMASAVVDGNGDLIISRNNAPDINAGSVIGPVGPQGPTGEVSNADLAALLSALGLSGKKILTGAFRGVAAVGNGAQGDPFTVAMGGSFPNSNYIVVASFHLEVKGSYSYFLMTSAQETDSFKAYVHRSGGGNLSVGEEVGINWIAIGDE